MESFDVFIITAEDENICRSQVINPRFLGWDACERHELRQLWTGITWIKHIWKDIRHIASRDTVFIQTYRVTCLYCRAHGQSQTACWKPCEPGDSEHGLDEEDLSHLVPLGQVPPCDHGSWYRTGGRESKISITNPPWSQYSGDEVRYGWNQIFKHKVASLGYEEEIILLY